MGSSLKGILPEEGGDILSNHVPKGSTVGSMIPTSGKNWGRAGSHLSVELGRRPKTTNCC